MSCYSTCPFRGESQTDSFVLRYITISLLGYEIGVTPCPYRADNLYGTAQINLYQCRNIYLYKAGIL